MKAEINLLPPAVQAERMQTLYLSRGGRIIRRIDTVLILLALLLGSIYGAFTFLEQSLTQKFLTTAPHDVTVEEETKRVNEVIAVTQARSAQHATWTPQLKELLLLLPNDLQLTALGGDDAKNTLTVSGTFTQRPAVIAFEHALEALPWVAQVQSPLQNLASGSKSEFTITITRRQSAP